MFATLTRRVTASLGHLVALTMCTKTMDVDVEVDTEMRAEVEEVLGIVLVDPMFATLGRTMNVIRAIHAGSTISRIVPAVMTEVAGASPVRKGGPRNKLRSGDWWCPICQIHKFGFREDCEKCGSKKTDDAVAEVDKIIQKNEEAGLPESFRPGDWMCPNCKDHIFAKHDTCAKCDNKTMKPTDGSAWGLAVDPSAPVNESSGDATSGTDDKAAGETAEKEDDEQPVVAEAA